MKKLFLVMLLASAFTLSACGSGSNNDAASEPQTEQGAEADENGAEDDDTGAGADTDLPSGDIAEAEGDVQRDPNHARPSELKTNYKGEDITYESALINSNIGFDILVDEDNFEYKAEDNAIHIISKDNMEVYMNITRAKLGSENDAIAEKKAFFGADPASEEDVAFGHDQISGKYAMFSFNEGKNTAEYFAAKSGGFVYTAEICYPNEQEELSLEVHAMLDSICFE